MEIVNLLHLTWKRVVVLVAFALLAGGVGFLLTTDREGDFDGSSQIVVSSLVGIDQPDYLAVSFAKSIRDLVLVDTNVQAALKASGATQGSGDTKATVADGGTVIDVTGSATSAKDAKAFAVALGRTAVDDAVARQLKVATASKAAAVTSRDAANTALVQFDAANGTTLTDALQAQRDALSNNLAGAQKAFDDAEGRLADVTTLATLAKDPAVVVPGGAVEQSVLAARMTVVGGAAAAAVALVLLLMLLADARSRRRGDDTAVWEAQPAAAPGPAAGESTQPGTVVAESQRPAAVTGAR